MGVCSAISRRCVLWLYMGGALLLWLPHPGLSTSRLPQERSIQGLTLTAAPRQSLPASDSTAVPITAHVFLDPGWQFPLVNVREPVTYRLHIERDAQVLVAPESVTPEALRRALVRATTLLPELFDIVDTTQRTEVLPNERVRDTTIFTLRFSKPGAYSIPALPITYSLEKSRRTTHTLQSSPVQGYMLTIDAHLPVGTGALPGDILLPVPLAPYAWSWLRYIAFGLLTGGMLTLVGGLLVRMPRHGQAHRQQRLSGRQLRQKYQTELDHIRQQAPALAGPLSAEARAWLRHSAALVRCLLGEWAYGEPGRFAGGAGVSTATALTHLPLVTPGQEAPFHPALYLIEELDVLAAAPGAMLTVDDYQRFGDAIQHIILQLTSFEASRVLRLPPRL
jgi:hypothetical protein